MNCRCDTCRGSGECPDCDGNGVTKTLIQYAALTTGMKNYDELVELKKDAHRVQRQANMLIEINPLRAESYRSQLDACLFAINQQANELSK